MTFKYFLQSHWFNLCFYRSVSTVTPAYWWVVPEMIRFLIVSGQQWRSLALRRKIYQTVTHSICKWCIQCSFQSFRDVSWQQGKYGVTRSGWRLSLEVNELFPRMWAMVSPGMTWTERAAVPNSPVVVSTALSCIQGNITVYNAAGSVSECK